MEVEARTALGPRSSVRSLFPKTLTSTVLQFVAGVIILRQDVEPDILQVINCRKASTVYFSDQQRRVVSADGCAGKNVRHERRVIGRGRIPRKEPFEYTHFVSAACASA